VFIGVNPVFTPALNTVKEDEIVNIIEYSGDELDGVKVLSEIPGGEGNNFEKAQEGPGNGHGNGEGVEDLDKEATSLAEEFTPLMNPKTILTPHLCRKGCKHYDSVGDQKSAEFTNSAGNPKRAE